MPKQVAGKIGYGQHFDNLVDGDYDFIDAGQDGSLNITGNQITLEAWVWHNITPNTRARLHEPALRPTPPARRQRASPIPTGSSTTRGTTTGTGSTCTATPFQCPNPNGAREA